MIKKISICLMLLIAQSLTSTFASEIVEDQPPEGKKIRKTALVSIEHLPVEIISNIFSFLNSNESFVSPQVCKTWKSIYDKHHKYTNEILRIANTLPNRKIDEVYKVLQNLRTYIHSIPNDRAGKIYKDFKSEKRQSNKFLGKGPTADLRYLMIQRAFDVTPGFKKGYVFIPESLKNLKIISLFGSSENLFGKVNEKNSSHLLEHEHLNRYNSLLLRKPEQPYETYKMVLSKFHALKRYEDFIELYKKTNKRFMELRDPDNKSSNQLRELLLKSYLRCEKYERCARLSKMYLKSLEERAKELNKKAHENNKEADKIKHTIASVCNNIFISHCKLSQFEKAWTYFKKSLKTTKRSMFDDDTIYMVRELVRQKNWKKALKGIKLVSANHPEWEGSFTVLKGFTFYLEAKSEQITNKMGTKNDLTNFLSILEASRYKIEILESEASFTWNLKRTIKYLGVPADFFQLAKQYLCSQINITRALPVSNSANKIIQNILNHQENHDVIFDREYNKLKSKLYKSKKIEEELKEEIYEIMNIKNLISRINSLEAKTRKKHK